MSTSVRQPEHSPRRGLRSAQHGSDARHKLVVVERAHDEVVAPAREGSDTIDRVGLLTTENDHRQVAIP